MEYQFLELYHDSRYDDVVYMNDIHYICIGFRKTLLRTSIAGFYTFLFQIQQIDVNREIINEQQSFMVETPCQELQILLSKIEMIRLRHMLQTAENELRKTRNIIYGIDLKVNICNQ